MESMPTFYNDNDLITADAIVLSRQNKIVRITEGTVQFWQASETGLQAMRDEAENVRLNKEIDLFIKQETSDRMKWDRWQKKNWWIVPFATIILSGLVSFIVALLVNHYSGK